jgi:hypothetical protein
MSLRVNGAASGLHQSSSRVDAVAACLCGPMRHKPKKRQGCCDLKRRNLQTGPLPTAESKPNGKAGRTAEWKTRVEEPKPLDASPAGLR